MPRADSIGETCVGTNNGERFEDFADMDLLCGLSRQAAVLHAGPWSIEDVGRLRGDTDISYAPTDPTVWGLALGAHRGAGGWRWSIVVNDVLVGAMRRSTLGHEIGHTYQADALVDQMEHGEAALCAPTHALSPVEQEAHVIGSIWTVPRAAVFGASRLSGEQVAPIARAFEVPSTYVFIRDALAVLLGEKRGDRRAASADLTCALRTHQTWMVENARLLSAIAQGE